MLAPLAAVVLLWSWLFFASWFKFYFEVRFALESRASQSGRGLLYCHNGSPPYRAEYSTTSKTTLPSIQQSEVQPSGVMRLPTAIHAGVVFTGTRSQYTPFEYCTNRVLVMVELYLVTIRTFVTLVTGHSDGGHR